MILGMMALDGDGSTQDDRAAFDWFERAHRIARERNQAPIDASDEASNGPGDEDASAPTISGKYWDRSQTLGKVEYERRMLQALRDVEADAEETLQTFTQSMLFREFETVIRITSERWSAEGQAVVHLVAAPRVPCGVRYTANQ